MNSNQDPRNLSMAEKKEFYQELLSLAIPIGLQNLLVALVGASDALMLGRLTQDAVSAVSLANQIAFIMNLFIGAVIGGGGVLSADPERFLSVFRDRPVLLSQNESGRQCLQKRSHLCGSPDNGYGP